MHGGRQSLLRRKVRPPRQPANQEENHNESSINPVEPTRGEPQGPALVHAQTLPMRYREATHTQRSYSTPDASTSSSIDGFVPQSIDLQRPHSFSARSLAIRTNNSGIANRATFSPIASHNTIGHRSQANDSIAIVTSSSTSVLPLGSQYSGQPGQQRVWNENGPYGPPQSAENNRNADWSSIDTISASNSWHSLQSEGPHGSREKRSSISDKDRDTTRNTRGSIGEDSEPFVESQFPAANGNHLHGHADLVSRQPSGDGTEQKKVRDAGEDSDDHDFSRSRNGSSIAHSREPSYLNEHGNNSTSSDVRRVENIHESLRSSAEHFEDFDIRNQLYKRQSNEGKENPLYATGNSGMGNRRLSGGSGTTTYTESTFSTNRASSSSVSDDEMGAHWHLNSLPSHNLNHYIPVVDLEMSYQRCKEQDGSDDANAFQCDVNVWQNDRPSNHAGDDQLTHITLLFDTQCHGSNWVAEKIVEKLCAKVYPLSQQAKFIGFNGQSMFAAFQTTLCFKKSDGGSTWWADFLVAPVKVPFDMLLGQKDCLKFEIIKRPTNPLLGLAVAKKSKDDRKEEPNRKAKHAREVEENEGKVQKMKEKQMEEERMRNRDFSQSKNKKRSP